MNLSGPDGKPLEQKARQMPSRQEKFNMVYMMFTLMDRRERLELVKSLKKIRARLDLMYPNGMTEGDIKNDLEKAAKSIVSDVQNSAEPQTAEVGAEPSVPAQPEGDAHSQEAPSEGATGGVQ